MQITKPIVHSKFVYSYGIVTYNVGFKKNLIFYNSFWKEVRAGLKVKLELYCPKIQSKLQ